MSTEAGFYGEVGGVEVYCHDPEGVAAAGQLSALLESTRRAQATNPKFSSALKLAACTADSLASSQPLAETDPALVCRVALDVLGALGGVMAAGVHPAMALDVVALATAMNAGHLPRPEPASGP